MQNREFITSSGKQNRSMEKPDDLSEVALFGIRLDLLTPTKQLLGLAAAIFFIYMGYGYSQENIFKTYNFQFGWFMTLVQFVVYIIYSLGERTIYGAPRRSTVTWKEYSIIAFLTVATMGLSNSALVYLSYPLQTIFKSSKVIPVMIAGFLFFRKRFKTLETVSMVMLVVGITFFTLGDIKANLGFNWKGLVLISLALVADSVIGNYQETVMKEKECSLTEMVLYSHVAAALLVLPITIANGELYEALLLCNLRPSLYFWLLLMSTFSYMGVSAVLSLLRLFGAVVTITVTTTRKFFTILLSFLVFPKPITPMHVFSGSLVFAALFLNVYAKNPDNVLATWRSFKSAIFGNVKLVKSPEVPRDHE